MSFSFLFKSLAYVVYFALTASQLRLSTFEGLNGHVKLVATVQMILLRNFTVKVSRIKKAIIKSECGVKEFR